MTGKATISRREFLALAAAAASTLLAYSQLPAAAALDRAQQDVLIARLMALLTHKDSARAIGRAYLDQYPQETNARALGDQLAASLAGSGAWPGTTSQAIPELLDHTLRRDFAADRIVTLNGWVLSVTEARLYALAALM